MQRKHEVPTVGPPRHVYVADDDHEVGMAAQGGRPGCVVAGVDGYHFLDSGREWVVNGRFVVSDVAGTARAIERLQLEPQRYFQRTDTPHVSFDPSRTSLRGWNGDVNFNRNQGAWTVNAAVWAVSPGFDSSDLGFHHDGAVHAFWLQLEGRRTVTIGPPVPPRTPLDLPDTVAGRDAARWRTIDLEPGSLFHLPPRTPHRVVCHRRSLQRASLT